jgi:hypothetical protein
MNGHVLRVELNYGSVAEWSIAPVLKTGGGSSPSVSSNLTASARFKVHLLNCYRSLIGLGVRTVTGK